MSAYTLSIDYGTTSSVGVVASDAGIEILELSRSRYLPSLVLLDPDGELLVGASAVNQAVLNPERVCATPKRLVGRPAILLGGEAIEVHRAIGAVLARLGAEAARRFGGAAPERLVLTHPALWADERLEVLREAAREAGLPEPELVSEPVAAAAHYANGSLGEGANVAVYDLGGGTFDAAVLRRLAGGGFEVAGRPGGDPNLGGEDFDNELRELVEGHAARIDPEAFEAARNSEDASRLWGPFRREIRQAKEALSDENKYPLVVPGLRDPVLVTRRELEDLLEPQLHRTIEQLAATIADAGLSPKDLDAIYLTGGSSSIPLVSTLISQELGVTPQTWGDPKAVVALGAVSAVAPPTTDADASGAGGADRGHRELVWCDPTRLGITSFEDFERYFAEHAKAVGLPGDDENALEAVHAYGPRLAVLGMSAPLDPSSLSANLALPPGALAGSRGEQYLRALRELVQRINVELTEVFGVGLNEAEEVLPLPPQPQPILSRWEQVERAIDEGLPAMHASSMGLLRQLAGANWIATAEEFSQVADADLLRLMRLWDRGAHGPLERMSWATDPGILTGPSPANPAMTILQERLAALRGQRDGAAPPAGATGAQAAQEVELRSARWASHSGSANFGVLTLTTRRLTWKAYGAAAPKIDVRLAEVTRVGSKSTTGMTLALRDGSEVRVDVTAFNRRSWMRAIEQAMQNARAGEGV